MSEKCSVPDVPTKENQQQWNGDDCVPYRSTLGKDFPISVRGVGAGAEEQFHNNHNFIKSTFLQ